MKRHETLSVVVWRGRRRRPLMCEVCLSICLLLVLVCNGCRAPRHTPSEIEPQQGGVETTNEPQSLSVGETVAKSLSGDATHFYRLNLSARQQARILFDKGDLNLLAQMCEPAGTPCIDFVSQRYGPLEAPFIAESTGTYKLEVRALERDSVDRPYRLHVTATNAAGTPTRQAYLAVRAFSEAEQLRTRWEEVPIRAAVEKYNEAGRLWQSAGESNNAAEAFRGAGDVHLTLSEYLKALNLYKKALDLSDAAGDKNGVNAALNKIAYVYIYLGEHRRAQSYLERVLNAVSNSRVGEHDVATLRLEAQALNNLGEVNYSFGDLPRSIELFRRALTIWTEAGGDRRGEALAHLNIGYSLTDQGDLQTAEQHYQQALALWQAVDDRRGIALAQIAISAVYSFHGENRRALNLLNQGVIIFRAMGDRQGQAVALNSVAAAYEDLDELVTALDNYSQALKLNREIGNRDFEAFTHYYIGRVYRSLGDTEQALEHYHQSVALSHELGKRRVEAYALSDSAAIYEDSGDKLKALAQYNEVLNFYRTFGDRRGQANTLNRLGDHFQATGEPQKASSYYQMALPLARASGDSNIEAITLYNLARTRRETGSLPEALRLIQESIELVDSLSLQGSTRTFRTSNFASVRRHYELYVDLLMRLNAHRPGEGFDARALIVSERARALSLLEALTEAEVPLYQGGNPELFRREREIQKSLAAKTEYRARLLNGVHTDEQARAIENEIRALTVEYQDLQAQLRERDPRYAALRQPAPLDVHDLQHELAKDDTLLLEFFLGDEKSYLWAVNATAINSFELPDRATIEQAAREVYSLLTVYQPAAGETSSQYRARVGEADELYRSRALSLSQMLLGSVAGQLGTKRLLIVSDGALRYVPFDALPDPLVARERTSNDLYEQGDGPEPLLLKHEIAGLPSALMLTTLRRENHPPAPKTIAVFADPVFEVADPRVKESRFVGAPAKETNDDNLLKGLKELDLNGIQRLPFTRHEASDIASLLPAGEVMVATDFDASRARVLSGELSNYRIVHFATHAISNDQHPELSGIAFSLVNKYGDYQAGYLGMDNIYGLSLSADLIVLSTCRPGLNKSGRGEGFVLLTRGFMYAGAKSVVISLWDVQDRAASELMKHFYSALLKDGATPAAALRSAKLQMLRQEQWNRPFYWASFTLQGEYQGHFDLPPRRYFTRANVLIAATLLPLLLSLYLWRARRRRRHIGT
jgi:CHAT domain-containing protein